MIEDFQEQQRKQGAKMRSIMDYTMGIVFFSLGVFFILYRQFGLRIMSREPSNLDYFIGGLFVVYGAWRFTVGLKRITTNERLDKALCFNDFYGVAGGMWKQCGHWPNRYDSGVLHISCDESFKPVIDAQIQVYEAQYPATKIIAHYKPEAECLADFAVDSIRMVIATRGPSDREKTFISDSLKVGTESFTVAYDAVAVIVHPQAKDSFFTLAELKDLIGGKSKKKLIPVFDGVKATSTVRFMLDSVLRGQPLGKNVVAANSTQGVIDYVARTPNAVGLLGISWIGNADDTAQLASLRKVRLARLESTDSVGGFVLPVQYLIYTRTYPLIRSLVYVLKEKYIGLAHGFAGFMRSDRGQLLFRRSYLYPGVRPFYARDTEL